MTLTQISYRVQLQIALYEEFLISVPASSGIDEPSARYHSTGPVHISEVRALEVHVSRQGKWSSCSLVIALERSFVQSGIQESQLVG